MELLWAGLFRVLCKAIYKVGLLPSKTEKKKNIVVFSKNAVATDSSPGARLGLNSLKAASGRCTG